MNDSQNLKKLIIRIFLFQVLIYFSIKSLKHESSYRDLRYKINSLKSSLGFNINDFYLNVPKYNPFFYKIILLLLIIMSLLSMANIKIIQFFCGLITIILSFLYYNPIDKFKEVKERHILLGAFNFDEYLPNTNFNILFAIGVAMIGESVSEIDLEKIFNIL